MVVREMTDLLALDLVDKGLVTDQIVLTIGYDIENLSDPVRRKQYRGEITTERYGRQVPKHAHGTGNLKTPTSSSGELTEAVMTLYRRLVDPALLIRRVTVTVNHLVREETVKRKQIYEQLDLFTDYEAKRREEELREEERAKEKKLQQAMLDIKKKYGKNAILKGSNLQEGATARSRNSQIGGHRA